MDTSTTIHRTVPLDTTDCRTIEQPRAIAPPFTTPLPFSPILQSLLDLSSCFSVTIRYNQTLRALLLGQNWQSISTLVIFHQTTNFLAKPASFSSLFNLQSKSINFKFGHFSPKYQGYSLTFWPKMPHFHHFSICNQNQSISTLVIFHQTTKAIALLIGQ